MMKSLNNYIKYLLILLFSLFSTSRAFAFPQAPFNAFKQDIKNKRSDEYKRYDFEGIVKLSNCSGALIRFNGQPTASKAYILTNGHCLGGRMIANGEAVVNKPYRRGVRIANKRMRFRHYDTTKIVYATMTGTDIALYELNATYDEILDRDGIRPLILSAVHPVIDTPINIVSGYWERGYKCHIDDFIFQLKEASWIFSDSIRYGQEGCHTIGGTSGSPIVEEGTREVIGINNTGNESGHRCTMNNPCEVDANGNISVVLGASYGQQTFQIYSCLRPDFVVDPNVDGCLLQH